MKYPAYFYALQRRRWPEHNNEWRWFARIFVVSEENGKPKLHYETGPIRTEAEAHENVRSVGVSRRISVIERKDLHEDLLASECEGVL